MAAMQPALDMRGSNAGIPSLEMGGQVTDAVFRASGSQTPAANLSLASETSTPVLAKGGSIPAPSFEQSAAGMPDDVRQWLEHLREIEAARMTLAQSEIGEAENTLGTLQAGGGADLGRLAAGDEDAIPDEKTSKTGEVRDQDSAMRARWQELETQFGSLTPPAVCQSLAATYSGVLHATGAMMVEVMGELAHSSTDPQAALKALYGMQGQSESRIGAPSRDCDQKLGAICAQFSTAKWFSIQNDVGGGLLTKG